MINMWFETYLIISKNILFSLSQIIHILILKYAASKTILSKTLLDYCIIDTCIIKLFLFTLIWFANNLVYFYGKVDYELGRIVIGLTIFNAKLMYAAYQISLIAKSILVFVPQLLENILDSQLRKITRISILIITLVFTINDFLETPKPFLFLTVLTGVNEPT